MLFTLQRYEFFSKSQRTMRHSKKRTGCCLPYKGTNFSANHNKPVNNRFSGPDVVYPTKVRIFQQITTVALFAAVVALMLFTLQRYEFFSKSQPISKAFHTCIDVVYPTKVRIFQQITTVLINQLHVYRCCLPYKGTNFSANHNDLMFLFYTILMLFTLQRYEFFSKSQLSL